MSIDDDGVTEIWGLIESYQPFADSRGFGKQRQA